MYTITRVINGKTVCTPYVHSISTWNINSNFLHLIFKNGIVHIIPIKDVEFIQFEPEAVEK